MVQAFRGDARPDDLMATKVPIATILTFLAALLVALALLYLTAPYWRPFVETTR